MKKLTIHPAFVVGFYLVMQNHVLFSQAPKDAKMECKLIVQKKNAAIGETPPAEVEIKNTSKEDICITYNNNPFEFLDLEVTDPAGKKISEGKYSDRFSPSSVGPGKEQLILRPNETYRGAVAVFVFANALSGTIWPVEDFT